MDIVSGNMGSVGVYDIQISGGKITATIEIPLADLAKPILEKVKNIIPGQVDDMIIDAIEAALMK